MLKLQALPIAIFRGSKVRLEKLTRNTLKRFVDGLREFKQPRRIFFNITNASQVAVDFKKVRKRNQFLDEKLPKRNEFVINLLLQLNEVHLRQALTRTILKRLLITRRLLSC